MDRSAFDRIIQAGGYITAPTGAAPEAHATPVPKADADSAFEHAECIGCGACVAACPNGSAMLFTSAKVNHLNVLPQGAPERETRVLTWSPDGRGGLRRLHPHRRVRHGLPEGHPAALDHRDEQGVAAGRRQAAVTGTTMPQFRDGPSRPAACRGYLPLLLAAPTCRRGPGAVAAIRHSR